MREGIVGKVLYYDCFSGISGDMNLAALLDLGVPEDYLRAKLTELGISGYTLEITRSSKMGIHGTRVDVKLHDDYHSHEHESHHDHSHRNLHDITHIIKDSSLSDDVKTTALAIFTKIAEAEAKVHGTTVDNIHFHEVGAIDSIVDIVGAAICLDWLKPSKIIALPIELGGGFVKCAHGTIPVPAPATLELLQGFAVKTGTVQFETTTPTGAAILSTMSTPSGERTLFTGGKIGYGIGHRDLEIPNVLRVILADDASIAQSESLILLECNIDDMTPELIGYAMETFFKQGALDAWCTPIIMKKGRPAITLSVLCDTGRERTLTEAVLRETTTFGLRRAEVSRKTLDRAERKITTSLGDVRFKAGFIDGVKIKEKPEYEDCRKIAESKNIPLRDVIDIVNKEKTE